MSKSTVFGIRPTEPLDTEQGAFIVDSVNQANKIASGSNQSFFFEEPSWGRTQRLAGLKLEDMFGWLVSEDQEEFERAWLAEDWDAMVATGAQEVSVTWLSNGDDPSPVFEAIDA